MAESPTIQSQLVRELEPQPRKDALTNMPITFHEFLNLPIELKEKVYEYALEDGGHFDNPPRFGKSTEWPRMPAPCYTSKQEHNIVAMVLVRNAGLYLAKDNDADLTERWLKKINGFGKTGLTAVKKAEVSYDLRDRHASTVGDIQFLSQCTNLHELTLAIPWEIFCPRTINYEKKDVTYHENLTINEVVDKLHLTDIRACGALTSLNIYVAGLMMDRIFGPGTPMFGEELAHWIMDEYKSAHERELPVHLVHSDPKSLDWKSSPRIVKAYPSRDGRVGSQGEEARMTAAFGPYEFLPASPV